MKGSSNDPKIDIIKKMIEADQERQKRSGLFHDFIVRKDATVKELNDKIEELNRKNELNIDWLYQSNRALERVLEEIRAARKFIMEQGHSLTCASRRHHMVGGISFDVNDPPKARKVYGECDCGYNEAMGIDNATST